MGNKAQATGTVKRDSPEKSELDSWTPRRVRLSEMCLRINGYLNGCFARGARFIIWDKHRFCRAIQGGKPRRLSHIEQAMTHFRKTSSNWRIEEIYYRGPRRGRGEPRTHRRLKITRAGDGNAPTQLETTIRFLAYVTNAVKQNGSAKVDRAFLLQFYKTTNLPPEWIRIAWQRMRKIRGYRVKWRGSGNGLKAVVSMPYFPRRSSFPYGKKIKNSGAPGAPDFSQAGSSAAGAARDPEAPRVPGPDGPAVKALTPLPPLPGGAGNFPPAPVRPAFRGAGGRGANGGRPPPLFIAGRWVSSAGLLRKAGWLAAVRMRPLHEGLRVRWRFAHSRNFAFRALRDGFPEERILEAWRRSLERSHEDACDHDLRERPDPDKPHPLREPSAAVLYSVQFLASDKRTPAERWAEFFAAPRPPARLRASGSRRKALPPGERDAPASEPSRATGARIVRGGAEAMPEEKLEGQKTIETHLRERGLSLEALVKMPREAQAAFVREAFQKQKTGFDKNGDVSK